MGGYRENNKIGAANGVRTRDLRLGKPTLYQLSYCRILFIQFKEITKYGDLIFEPPTGLEPATHALRKRCSTN